MPEEKKPKTRKDPHAPSDRERYRTAAAQAHAANMRGSPNAAPPSESQLSEAARKQERAALRAARRGRGHRR